MIKTFKAMPSWQCKILLGIVAVLAVWLFGVFTGYTWIKYMSLTMFPLAFCSRTFLWNLIKELSTGDSVEFESDGFEKTNEDEDDDCIYPVSERDYYEIHILKIRG